jgi:hypothetical protein
LAWWRRGWWWRCHWCRWWKDWWRRWWRCDWCRRWWWSSWGWIRRWCRWLFGRIWSHGIDCTNPICQISVPSKVKVSFYTPISPPWILYYPVILIVFRTVSHY